MSSNALIWVLRRSPLTGTALVVHLMLGDVANEDEGNECWMRQDVLAGWARTTRGTVNRCLASLVDDGFLEVLAAPSFGSVRFRLVMDDEKYPERYGARVDAAARKAAARVSKSRTAIPPMPPPPVRDSDTRTVRDSRAAACAIPAHITIKGNYQEEISTSPPPKASGKSSRSKSAPRSTPEADKLAKDEWERRPIKPTAGFVAFRSQIQRALDAGASVERLAGVLPDMANFSDNSFDFHLNGKGKRNGLRSVPLPISADRDAPEGLVQT